MSYSNGQMSSFNGNGYHLGMRFDDHENTPPQELCWSPLGQLPETTWEPNVGLGNTQPQDLAAPPFSQLDPRLGLTPGDMAQGQLFGWTPEDEPLQQMSETYPLGLGTESSVSISPPQETVSPGFFIAPVPICPASHIPAPSATTPYRQGNIDPNAFLYRGAGTGSPGFGIAPEPFEPAASIPAPMANTPYGMVNLGPSSFDHPGLGTVSPGFGVAPGPFGPAASIPTPTASPPTTPTAITPYWSMDSDPYANITGMTERRQKRAACGDIEKGKGERPNKRKRKE